MKKKQPLKSLEESAGMSPEVQAELKRVTKEKDAKILGLRISLEDPDAPGQKIVFSVAEIVVALHLCDQEQLVSLMRTVMSCCPVGALMTARSLCSRK